MVIITLYISIKKVATKSMYYHTEVPVGLTLLKELCQDNCMCRSLSSSAEMKRTYRTMKCGPCPAFDHLS